MTPGEEGRDVLMQVSYILNTGHDVARQHKVAPFTNRRIVLRPYGADHCSKVERLFSLTSATTASTSTVISPSEDPSTGMNDRYGKPRAPDIYKIMQSLHLWQLIQCLLQCLADLGVKQICRAVSGQELYNLGSRLHASTDM